MPTITASKSVQRYDHPVNNEGLLKMQQQQQTHHSRSIGVNAMSSRHRSAQNKMMIKNFIRQHKAGYRESHHPATMNHNTYYNTINSNSHKNFNATGALNSDLGDDLNSGKLGNIDLSGLAGKYETHQTYGGGKNQ